MEIASAVMNRVQGLRSMVATFAAVEAVPAENLGATMRIGWLVVGALLLFGPGGSAPSFAQGTGEFLCSAGTRDGQPCTAFSDCPGGVCIIAQGVCADGAFCSCPGGGTCSPTPACSLDVSFGTCAGGVADGVCCALGFDCPPGDSCTATHRVCLSGPFQGFACTNAAMCDGAPCGSNGFFCSDGAADGFPCVTNDDCPGGFCDQSFMTPPTNTPVTVPTSTPGTGPTSPPQQTPVPTATLPSIPNLTPGIVPTSTPHDTPEPATPTPTFTPVIGVLLPTAENAAAGSNRIVVDIDPAQFPVQGVIEVQGITTEFTRRRSSRVLDLRLEGGLPANLPAGSIVRVVEFTPTPGRVGQELREIDEGRGCAVAPHSGGYPGLALGAFGLLLAGLRRRAANT